MSNPSNIKVVVNIKMSLGEYKGILIDILLTGVPFRFLYSDGFRALTEEKIKHSHSLLIKTISKT